MAEFVNSPVMSVTMPLDVTSDATIAQATDTATASKSFTIQGIKKNATLTESAAVYDKFAVQIGGGNYDSLRATRTIKEGVA